MKSLNNNNEAMEFAYAMGLRRENEAQEEETNEALAFAYAMGLKRYKEGLGTIERRGHFGRPAAEPKFA